MVFRSPARPSLSEVLGAGLTRGRGKPISRGATQSFRRACRPWGSMSLSPSPASSGGVSPRSAERRRSSSNFKQAEAIGGIVRDEQGRPIEGARVFPNVGWTGQVWPEIEASSKSGCLIATTDAEGRWRSDALPVGTRPDVKIRVRVTHPDHSIAVWRTSARQARASTSVQVMRPGRSISGKVLGPFGRPVSQGDGRGCSATLGQPIPQADHRRRWPVPLRSLPSPGMGHPGPTGPGVRPRVGRSRGDRNARDATAGHPADPAPAGRGPRGRCPGPARGGGRRRVRPGSSSAACSTGRPEPMRPADSSGMTCRPPAKSTSTSSSPATRWPARRSSDPKRVRSRSPSVASSPLPDARPRPADRAGRLIRRAGPKEAAPAARTPSRAARASTTGRRGSPRVAVGRRTTVPAARVPSSGRWSGAAPRESANWVWPEPSESRTTPATPELPGSVLLRVEELERELHPAVGPVDRWQRRRLAGLLGRVRGSKSAF